MGISVTTDYTGRKKDIYISYGVDPTKVGTQKVTYSFGQVSNVIAGVQKLAQRYLIALFNTGLVQQLQTAKSYNIQEATHIFNLASWTVLQAFKTYQNNNPDFPEDEQLASAQLTDLSVSAGKINLKVELVTKAGTGLTVVLPVALT